MLILYFNMDISTAKNSELYLFNTSCYQVSIKCVLDYYLMQFVFVYNSQCIIQRDFHFEHSGHNRAIINQNQSVHYVQKVYVNY